jgi:broad specificity phosphatase PhoE
MKFYLVRHGVKEPIPVDPALTKIGIKQAEVTAAYLTTIPFQAIITSPKIRTYQTAEIIAKKLKLPLSTDERLVERMEWEQDEPLDVFLADWDKTDKDRNYQPTHEYSSTGKGKHMKEVLEDLSQKYQKGNILLVTHGGAIGDLLRNLFTEETIPHVTNPTSGATYIDILECSVTII